MSSQLPEGVAVDRRQAPKYSKKKTAQKALRDAFITAGTTGVIATAAALTDPHAVGTIVDAVSQLVPGPWGALIALGLPPAFAFLGKVAADWGSRVAVPEVKKKIGASAFAQARVKRREG